MNKMSISRRIQTMSQTAGQKIDYLLDPRWEDLRKDPEMCDFLLGNPQEFPLPGITTALNKWSAPQNKDWFAYKMSETHSQQVVAATLNQSHHQAFDPADIFMTTGAFSALSATLNTIVDPGDEIIYISPPWFFYEMLIVAYGGQPVPVPCDRSTFDLDLTAVQRAITAKTRGIIINSPNNPTGRIYPPETLSRLADLLTEASQRNGRPVYILSDEAYSHILFDQRPFPSPTSYYPNTFLIYTYGKTLLAPGQRIGYIALPPAMPDKDTIHQGLTTAMVACGYIFPNALLQYALGDLEQLSIDVNHLQEKRDRLVNALRKMGYETNLPEGTFYLLVRSPLPDEMAFMDLLAEHKIYCLPGTIFDLPGYFRISLTANDAMIDRALPGFAKALAASQSQPSPTLYQQTR